MDLLTYIMEQLLETECKLGYSETAVHLNLPPRTAGGFFGDRDLPIEETKAKIEAAFAGQAVFAGSTSVVRDGMLLLSIGVGAVAYAHREYKASHPAKAKFISELVDAVMMPFCSKEQIHAVFAATGRAVAYEMREGGEFDEIIRFADAEGEPLYCFEYGEERTSYHRLLPDDFRELFE